MISFYYNFDVFIPDFANIDKFEDEFLISANIGFAFYCFLIIFSLTKFSFFKNLILPDFSLEKINKNIINKFSIFLFLFLLITCLPYWYEYDIQKTGLYTLFFDPAAHYLSREETIKLASEKIFIKPYLIGSNLSLIIIPLLSLKFLKSKYFTRKLITILASIFVILICNINGARSPFIFPFVFTAILFYMTNTYNIRFSLIETFVNLKNKLTIKKKRFKNIILLFLISLFLLSFLILISMFAANRLIDFAIFKVFMAVFYRTFLANYNTGAINIMAINELNIPIASYLGGVPGASFLTGYEGESVFRIVGNYAGYKFSGITNDTNNMNTSGLFLNIGFYGTFIGAFIFYLNLTLNLWFAKLLLINSNKYFSFNLRVLSTLTIFWLLACSSFEISSTTFSLFPMRWVYSFLLLFSFRFIEQINYKF